MAGNEIQAPIFEFTGNRLCLDFVNTIHDRAGTPRELLYSYDDLIAWSLEGDILTEAEAEQLRKKADQQKAEAAAVLRQAIDLRETIYRICFAIATDVSPAEVDLSAFNDMLAKAMAHAYLQHAEDSFVWDWRDKGQALDRMLWPVVRSTADVLSSEDRDSVRVCAAEDCSWMFLDTSKNHSRRWCDMKSCGNRAKVRKHYSQKKQSA